MNNKGNLYIFRSHYPFIISILFYLFFSFFFFVVVVQNVWTSHETVIQTYEIFREIYCVVKTVKETNCSSLRGIIQASRISRVSYCWNRNWAWSRCILCINKHINWVGISPLRIEYIVQMRQSNIIYNILKFWV